MAFHDSYRHNVWCFHAPLVRTRAACLGAEDVIKDEDSRAARPYKLLHVADVCSSSLHAFTRRTGSWGHASGHMSWPSSDGMLSLFQLVRYRLGAWTWLSITRALLGNGAAASGPVSFAPRPD